MKGKLTPSCTSWAQSLVPGGSAFPVGGTLCSSFQSCSFSTQTASGRKQPQSTLSPAGGREQSLRLPTCSHHQPASSWLLSTSISSAQAGDHCGLGSAPSTSKGMFYGIKGQSLSPFVFPAHSSPLHDRICPPCQAGETRDTALHIGVLQDTCTAPPAAAKHYV